MKLYNAVSGNTKRVRIFIAEKDIDISRIELKLGTDTRTPKFLKLNSLGEVPVLELGDGRVITESLAICRYLEAAFPDIPLMGIDAFDQGHIEMWSQRIYGQLFLPYGLFVRHTLPLFSDSVEQVSDFAETQRRGIPDKWHWLDTEMSDGRPFIAGNTFSFADVQGMTVLMIADALDLPVPSSCQYVGQWAGKMRDRRSWVA